MDAWDAVLGKIQTSLEIYLDGSDFGVETDGKWEFSQTKFDTFNEGMDLFHKYFMDLWT
jgi:hypothetical protein